MVISSRDEKEEKKAQLKGQQTAAEIETTRRLNVSGFTFEETVNGTNDVIRLSGNGLAEQDLTETDVDNIIRFFAGFQRRQRRDGDQQNDDGRGQVTDPSTDKRLRENR